MSDQCGTTAGYQVHRKNGEDACEPCRVAKTGYQRDRRASLREVREREKKRAAARRMAYARLVHLHREDFDRLFDEELTRNDLG
jgi:hypothetical protein